MFTKLHMVFSDIKGMSECCVKLGVSLRNIKCLVGFCTNEQSYPFHVFDVSAEGAYSYMIVPSLCARSVLPYAPLVYVVLDFDHV
jgi:hypothetical protein